MKSKHTSIANVNDNKQSGVSIFSMAIAAFVLLIFFYFSFGTILTFIDANILSDISMLRRYNFPSKIILSIVAVFFCIKFLSKRNDFNLFMKNWLLTAVISFVLSGVLSSLLGNTSFWFIKYLIGALAGCTSYFVNQKLQYSSSSISWITGAIAVLASLFGSNIEYLQTMEPPIYPSLLYIRSFESPFFWVMGVLIIFLPAYFLSKGWLLKTFFNR